MDWQKMAKALPYGASRKVQHCGSSPAARINHSNAGISLYCFRCGEQEFIPHGPRSAAEILAARAATEELREARDIPKRCQGLNEEGVPSEALLWTLRTGLTPEEATNVYGFKYDPKTRRVLIPLKGGFIARAVFMEQPKYIRSGSMDQEVWEQRVDESNTVVITEDILSAIKVYRSGFSSIAILGTSISTTAASRIGMYDHVICWTDGDKAGDAAWLKLRKRMALYDTTLSRIRTKDDPKNIPITEIKTLIKDTSYEYQ
jgi:hypothetical protein